MTVIVSAAVNPEVWLAWLAMLARMDFPALGDGLWFLPIPLWFRVLVAAALIAWGAAHDRQWVLPIGICLSLPTVWLNSPTILVALLPLAAASATTPASVWLRSDAARAVLVAPRLRVRTWLRWVAAQSRATLGG